MTSNDKPARSEHRAGARKKSPGQGAGKPAAAAAEASAGVPERIAKILARAGVASRRDAERMVMEGRVSVNGTVLETPAVTVLLSDRIEVDGTPIRGIERTRLWLYYKPIGLVTTNSDPDGRPTVFDNLPGELPRVLSIGRLDINTEGLLLLTNDGGLARVLELPSTGWLRRYRVRAHGAIDQAALDRLKEGIAVDGVLYGAIEATLDRVQGSNVWITMGLREGKNREIKNVLGALGLSVNRLIRISYGPFQLADLTDGAVREIHGRTLRDQLGPRLIAEAHANFDAPVFDGSNAEGEARAVGRPAGGHAKEKPAGRPRDKESRGDKRDRALAKLDTRAAGAPGGKDSDKRPKRKPPLVSRTTNVWMAPGARPVAPKKAKAAAERAEREEARSSERPRSRSARPHGGKAADRAPAGAARPQRSAKSGAVGKPGKPRGDGKPFAGDKRGTAKPAGGGKPARQRSEGRPAQDRPGKRKGPRDADRRR